MAFCPATDAELIEYNVKGGNNDLRRRVLTGKHSSYKASVEKIEGSTFLKNRTYIVSAKSIQDDTGGKLRYCGRARRLSDTCE